MLENEELIFANSYPIEIPSYKYTDAQDDTIVVRGDSGYESSYLDTLSSAPVLAWETTRIQLLTVAIFTSPIRLSNGEINPDSIIWKWSSGMHSDYSNAIQYSEGINVHSEANITELLPSGLYYWGIWGWSQSGTRILYSSRELKFYVSN